MSVSESRIAGKLNRTSLGRPTVLSIAGFDPSGGAGLLQDIKTFAALSVHGVGVASAITYQHDAEFAGLKWIELPEMMAQLEPLVWRYDICAVKIGLIQDLDILDRLISFLRARAPEAQIVWDPIVQASAGFTFHQEFEEKKIREVLLKLNLVTPNQTEAKFLLPGGPIRDLGDLSELCPVLLKGGDAGGDLVTDSLYRAGQITHFQGKRIPEGAKHGSGCVLSAAIAANLALDQELTAACESARKFVRSYLESSKTLVGHLKIGDGALFPKVGTGTAFPKTTPDSLVSRLQLITQESEDVSHLEMIEHSLQAGVRWIQLRVKGQEYLDWLTLARRAKTITDEYGAVLIVNDSVRIAQEIGTSGVHLGAEDTDPEEARRILGDKFIIGGTANTFDDVDRLAHAEVDYIGLGPFRQTTTKAKLSPVLGLERTAEILRRADEADITIPIIAVGGIELGDIDPLFKAGISGVAVSGAIARATDIRAAAHSFLEAVCQS